MVRVDNSFFENKTPIEIAKSLLGIELVHLVNGVSNSKIKLSGIINEVELYLENDESSHCYNSIITNKNKSLFKKAGHLYVYFTYGMYYCINIVVCDENIGGGILIRGVIPKDGIVFMIKNRYSNKFVNKDNISKFQFKNISNGPAKLTIAFNIKKQLDGINLLDKNSNIYLQRTNLIPKKIFNTKRIGISKNKDELLRFFCEKFE